MHHPHFCFYPQNAGKLFNPQFLNQSDNYICAGLGFTELKEGVGSESWLVYLIVFGAVWKMNWTTMQKR